MSPQAKSNVEEYAKRIPDEIKRAVGAINGDVQYAIVVLLIKEKGLAFTQLEERLGIHQHTLSKNLDKLMDGGLLDREEFAEHSERYKAKYTITSFGERFLDHLFESIDPIQQRQAVRSDRNIGVTNEGLQEEPTNQGDSVITSTEGKENQMMVNS